jgi:ferrochelatase
VAGELDNHSHNLEVIHAFRYSPPTIENAIADIAKNNADEIILVPLFPHRTAAMTGSIEKKAAEYCKRYNLKLSFVADWGNRQEIIAIWSKYIEQELIEISGDCFVLFAAHGIPLRDVNKGDRYPDLVKETAKTLADMLPDNVGWSLAFQSRVGPVRWTGPYLEDEIIRISELSKNLLLMPLSFVADCLETLYDLDIVATKLAKDSGFEKVRRVRVFNDDPRFAKALASIAREAM